MRDHWSCFDAATRERLGGLRPAAAAQRMIVNPVLERIMLWGNRR